MTPYSGKIIAARIVTLRFSQSGYTISVNVEPGQVVTKGQVLAALDPKPVQTQLDVELADYRRIRSEFDQLSRDLPEAKNETEKGIKEIAQSKLDVSVKSVEKIKYDLDHLTMICPVNGIVLDTSSLVDGIYITPSSNPIIVAESDSIAFEINLPETDLAQAIINKELEINLASGQSLKSKITWIAPEAKDGKFAVHLKPDNVSGLRLGQTGQVNF